MSERSLLGRSVGAFIDAVASDAEPVPAGACSAALTGALSAALVVLVCRVLQGRRAPPDVSQPLSDAERLRTRLAGLIDADAAAFQAFTSARRLDSGPTRDAALAEATRPPLEIAASCADVALIARALAPLATGSIQSDIGVAVRLADAAARAALDTAAQNVASLEDSPQRAELQKELERLRSAT